MASCFRTVSNRLCCSNYLKTPGILHLDTKNTSSTKITQSNSFNKENYNFHASTINCKNYVSAYSPLLLKSTLIPLSTSSVSSQDSIAWFRQTNSVQNLPPPNDEVYKNTILLAEKLDKKVSKDPPNYGRPSEEHLEHVLQVLSQDLTKVFVKPLSYEIYSPNIILENNINGTTSVGLTKYATKVALLRTLAHIRFAYVKFFILKITKHPEEGTIKCRWQIKGIGGLKTIFSFWKLRPSAFADSVTNAPTWYDGFSIYYVGSDGKIYKHIIDKMMPDNDKIVEDKTTPITKLALFLGLKPNKRSIVFIDALRDYFKDVSLSLKVIYPLEKLK